MKKYIRLGVVHEVDDDDDSNDPRGSGRWARCEGRHSLFYSSELEEVFTPISTTCVACIVRTWVQAPWD